MFTLVTKRVNFRKSLEWFSLRWLGTKNRLRKWNDRINRRPERSVVEDSSQEEFREPTEQEAREMQQRYLDALNDRGLLSIHGAGHGVVANHFDMGVVRVVVRPGNRTSYTEVSKRPPSKETLHQDLVMALAGYYAVLKETGEEYIANIHCGFDNQLMFDLFAALSIADKDQKQWMKEANPVSQQLVDRYWPAIKRIADAPVEKGDITGADVGRIVIESQ